MHIEDHHLPINKIIRQFFCHKSVFRCIQYDLNSWGTCMLTQKQTDSNYCVTKMTQWTSKVVYCVNIYLKPGSIDIGDH